MGNLKAGVGRADITPPVGMEIGIWALRKGLSRGIHDRMYARALVLDDGTTPAAVVNLDVAYISSEMTSRVRDLVAEQTAIPRSNILLNCSHTHTSPHVGPAREGLSTGHGTYLEAFPHYIAGAIFEAWHNRKEAAIGAASTMVTGITVNRRDPRLPVDPELGVIRVDGEGGQPLACLVNYTCHGTTVGAHHLDWTADFPGYLARTVEGAVPGCACLFLQGAEGDIHPWDWYFGNENPRWNDHYDGAERLGKAIAGPALGLLQQIETVPEAKIGAATNVITLPPRPITWTVEEAEAYLAEVEATTEPYREDVIPDDCPGCMSAQSFPGPYRLGAARGAVQFARQYPTGIDAELAVLGVNNIVLAANSGEMYSGLGKKIKEKSPAEKTYVLSCTNGWAGYFPTRQALEETVGLSLEEFVNPVQNRKYYGATSTCRVGPGAGEMIVAETLRLIDQL
jgi:hypothetical protein